jgi:hypothetical protein
MVDNKRESLEDFEARFGKLEDRFDQSVIPELEQTNLPLAQTDERRAEETEAQSNDNAPEPYQEPYLPNVSSHSAFEQAANDSDQRQRPEVNSKMVGDEAPEHNLPPPENTDDVDRQQHAYDMAGDDSRSKNAMNDEYFKDLEQSLEQGDFDQYSHEHEQDYDQSR